MRDVPQESGQWPASDERRILSDDALLRVTRNPARWRDRLRSYKVLADGSVVGTIGNGRTADFSIPVGHHEIRISLGWAGSNALFLDLAVGDVAQVECEPGGSAMTALFGAFATLRKKGRPWIDLHLVSDYANSPLPPEAASAPPPPCHQRQAPSHVSTNGFSIASLILGIVWGFGLASILALIFGYVAKNEIDKSAGSQRGRTTAIAGIVLGWVGVAILLLFIVVGAFASDKPNRPTTTPTSTVLTTAAAAQAYLGLIDPVNSAADTFATEAGQWTNETTDSQAEHEAQPVISVLQTLERKLLHTGWPTSARQDVKTLASEVSPVVADLGGLTSLDLRDASSWEARFGRDVAVVKAADNVVRHDLGLPAQSAGGAPGRSSVGGTQVGPSNSTSAGSTTSSPASNGGTTSAGSAAQGGSCFGCVTITTVTWGFYSAPGTLTDYQSCIPRNATVASNTQVAGPPVANPTRQFTYRANFTIGCALPDGVEFSVGKVELQGANPPISVISTDPAVPFVVTPQSTQTLAVTFHALDGNYYNGPLVIDVIFD